MLAATSNAGDSAGALDRDPPRLITRQLSIFAVGWLTSALAWGFVLTLQARLPVFPATLLFVFQLGVLLTAIGVCHYGASRARIPLVAFAACVLLALSSTWLFAAIGGHGEMLAFILLTLYLASSPLFAWSGRAALMLFVSTLLPWLLAIPFLEFFMRPAELVTAIAIGAIVSLVILEGTRRNFRLAREQLAVYDVYRDLAEKAPDPIFTADVRGRLTYVNEAFARYFGEPASALVGRPWYNLLADHAANPLARGTGEAALSSEEQRLEVRAAGEVRWISSLTSPIRDQHDRLMGVRGIWRDVTKRHLDEQALRAAFDELRRNEEALGRLTAARGPGDDDGQARPPRPDGADEAADGIDMLRGPLRTLKDEEVQRLKREAERLRVEIAQRQEEIERRSGEVGAIVADGGAEAGDAAAPPARAPFQFPERFRRKRGRRRKAETPPGAPGGAEPLAPATPGGFGSKTGLAR